MGTVDPHRRRHCAAHSDSCGVAYEVGQQYLLFVTDGQGIGRAFETGLCHGPSATPGRSDVRGSLEQLLGPPHRPGTSAPAIEITCWTRATAAVPVPSMVLIGVVAVGVLWWTTAI